MSSRCPSGRSRRPPASSPLRSRLRKLFKACSHITHGTLFSPPVAFCTRCQAPSGCRYIENAQYVDGVRKLSAAEVEAIDLIEEIGLEIGHDFLQLPGQVSHHLAQARAIACRQLISRITSCWAAQLTFLNNHLVYHGRTAWKFAEAHETADARDNVDNGRLLLRAWIAPYNSRPLPDTAAFREMWGDVRSGVPRGGLEPALKAGIKAKPPELIEAYTSGKADYCARATPHVAHRVAHRLNVSYVIADLSRWRAVQTDCISARSTAKTSTSASQL